MSLNQTQEPTLVPNAGQTLLHENEIEELMQRLPKAPNFIMGSDKQLVKYQNFWFPKKSFKNIIRFQNQFVALDTYLIIASLPKCGTTWLKALLFAIVNRVDQPTSQSPLLSHHPHELVHRLEDKIYGDHLNESSSLFLNKLSSPRLFNTHLPYTTLSESIKTSRCRILYIGRNPLDTCVSQWHFYTKIGKKRFGQEFEPYNIQDYFEDCIEGKIMYGPFFEHVVEYWKLSLERPDKVLFLKYEDLKEDPILELKRAAEFVGLPFSQEEESRGVINDIIELCSINNLKDLEVNKNGVNFRNLDHKDFFRKGEVGDWTNHFTPSMVAKMSNLMQEKLEGTGLTFKLAIG